MIYCRDTTENHGLAEAYPACVEDINSHIADEGYSGVAPLFTNQETVIDLDAAEIMVAASENRLLNQSMDMTVGLKNDDASVQEMLLVDFKLRMTNPNNLLKDDMTGKVDGSSLILGNTIPIRHEYIFVFQPNKVQEARNRLSRMIPTIPNAYVAMDINTLHATYF